MAECRRLIAFNQEVADPGKSVRHHRPHQRIPGMSNGESDNQHSQSKQSSHRMHGTIPRIAMLVQVEREEIFIAGKFLWRHYLSLSCGGGVGRSSMGDSCPSANILNFVYVQAPSVFFATTYK